MCFVSISSSCTTSYINSEISLSVFSDVIHLNIITHTAVVKYYKTNAIRAKTFKERGREWQLLKKRQDERNLYWCASCRIWVQQSQNTDLLNLNPPKHFLSYTICSTFRMSYMCCINGPNHKDLLHVQMRGQRQHTFEWHLHKELAVSQRSPFFSLSL